MRSRFHRYLAPFHDSFIWTAQSWLRDKKSATFIHHHNAAMKEVLNACAELKLNFWAIEGTLIALLRYGHLGKSGENPSIDDDIDLMVAHESHEAWTTAALGLRETLLRQGWEDAFRAGPLLSTSDTPGARRDKLKLRKFSAKSRRIWTHLDLHSGIISNCRNYLISHDTTHDYPFQQWNGRLPWDWISPLRTARFNDQTCPVPQRSIEILAGWNNGEYDEKTLLYPLRPLGVEERRHIDRSVTELDQAGYASFASLLPSESP